VGLIGEKEKKKKKRGREGGEHFPSLADTGAVKKTFLLVKNEKTWIAKNANQSNQQQKERGSDKGKIAFAAWAMHRMTKAL